MPQLAPAEEGRALSRNERLLHGADNDSFRAAMRSLASGVCLVTHGFGSEANGLTATAVSALSSEPPSLVLCINRSASLYARLAPGALIGVNVIGGHQQEIADRFAGRTGAKGHERFGAGRWLMSAESAPLLIDALAALECEIEEVIERHTHAIVIGRVRRVSSRNDGMALVYWRGAYDQLGWSDEELARAIGVTPRLDRRTTGDATIIRFSE